MGGDGRVGYQNQYTARDAYGLTLNFYDDEYKPIGFDNFYKAEDLIFE